jgi:hypothetical protein
MDAQAELTLQEPGLRWALALPLPTLDPDPCFTLQDTMGLPGVIPALVLRGK